MNWHFLLFFLDIVGWMGIALLSQYIFIALTNKAKLINIFKLDALTVAICGGLISILMNGLPDVGFSINSFIYAFAFSFSYILYQQMRKKTVKTKKIVAYEKLA